MRKNMLLLFFAVLVLFYGCQKEISPEVLNVPARAQLQDDASGDCLPKTVNGSYSVGVPLSPTTNTIVVQLNVTRTGNYTIGTDTINGYYFRNTGTFTTVGSKSVTLRGNGTPIAAGINTFTVTYDTTSCDIQVTVVAPAVFSLTGAPNACSGAIVTGAYANGVPLSAANIASLNVNVTSIGAYSITTNTIQGMTFTKTGTFTVTGPQQVILTGTGTPTSPGTHTLTVTAGISTCTFPVTVVSAGAATLVGAPNACSPATIQGNYILGAVLTAANKVSIQINVTSPGVFSITTNTVAGFSFTWSGNIAASGNQTVILAATGTPTAGGPQTFTVTLGTSSCTFTVNVDTQDYFPRTIGSNWSYEYENNATDSTYKVIIPNTLSAGGNNYAILMQIPDVNGFMIFDTSNYIRRSGGDYYEWGEYGIDDEVWSADIFLKDNVSASTTWTTNSFATFDFGVPYTYRFRLNLTQKDVTKTITTSRGTVTYPNTIAVESHIEVLVGATWINQDNTQGYLINYYARGVGMIQQDTYQPATSSFTYLRLRRYEIM